MTDKQSNHVDMILNTIRVYDDNQATIDSKPDVGAQFILLKTKRAFINIAIGGQSGSTATDKSLIRKDLDEFSFGIMAPVKAWAVTQNNVTVKDEMDYSISDLGKVKDDTYVEFLRHRRDIVNGLIGSLGGLGFTAVLIVEWDLKISTYEASITDPRQAIINKALHTENLDKYIKEALVICNDVLDGLMVLFKTAAFGDLYNKYVMAREIIDLTGPGDGTDPGVNAVINISFTDAVTGLAVEGAEVELSGITEKEVTDAEGEVQFDVAPAVYTATVTKAGYSTGNFSLEAETAGVYNFTFQLTPMP
jgi:hypothetical protein